MSRIAEGEAETACPLTREPPRPDPVLRRGSGWRLSGRGFGWRQIGVVGIAAREMSKWREEVVRALTPDGADDISGFASDGVGAFHQRKIAVGCSAKQRVEILADIVRDTHDGSPK